jgi:hypothetical protein
MAEMDETFADCRIMMLTNASKRSDEIPPGHDAIATTHVIGVLECHHPAT